MIPPFDDWPGPKYGCDAAATTCVGRLGFSGGFTPFARWPRRTPRIPRPVAADCGFAAWGTNGRQNRDQGVLIFFYPEDDELAVIGKYPEARNR